RDDRRRGDPRLDRVVRQGQPEGEPRKRPESADPEGVHQVFVQGGGGGGVGFDSGGRPRDAVGVTKSVTVAELTEHLAEHLAEVREGTTIEVVDDGKKIATIEPPP